MAQFRQVKVLPRVVAAKCSEPQGDASNGSGGGKRLSAPVGGGGLLSGFAQNRDTKSPFVKVRGAKKMPEKIVQNDNPSGRLKIDFSEKRCTIISEIEKQQRGGSGNSHLACADARTIYTPDIVCAAPPLYPNPVGIARGFVGAAQKKFGVV